MLRPYDQRPRSYVERRGDVQLDWEFAPRKYRSLFQELDQEPLEQLLLEAEIERLRRQLPHATSWSSRVRAYVQVFLDEVRCRMHSYVGQPCPERAI